MPQDSESFSGPAAAPDAWGTSRRGHCILLFSTKNPPAAPDIYFSPGWFRDYEEVACWVILWEDRRDSDVLLISVGGSEPSASSRLCLFAEKNGIVLAQIRALDTNLNTYISLKQFYICHKY